MTSHAKILYRDQFTSIEIARLLGPRGVHALAILVVVEGHAFARMPFLKRGAHVLVVLHVPDLAVAPVPFLKRPAHYLAILVLVEDVAVAILAEGFLLFPFFVGVRVPTARSPAFRDDSNYLSTDTTTFVTCQSDGTFKLYMAIVLRKKPQAGRAGMEAKPKNV